MEHLRAPVQKFAMSLFQACRKQNPTGNLLYSPMNAAAGVFLILLGSDGSTKAEIVEAIKLLDSHLFISPTFEDDMKLAFRYILSMIGHVKEEISDPTNRAFQVFRMNKLFVKEDVTILPLFVEQAGKLKAELTPINFAKNCNQARHQINEYVKEKTDKHTYECFLPGAIDKETTMVLVNGMSFASRWEQPFLPENTKVEKFHQLNGEVVDVEMMHTTLSLPYLRNAETGVTYVEIPYLSNAVSMLIFLPIKKDGLKEFGESLNPYTLNKINLHKRVTDVDLKMPKFSMKNRWNMKTFLEKIGIKALFGEGADFSRMTGNHSVILSAAVHSTYFDVGENGSGLHHHVKEAEDSLTGRKKPLGEISCEEVKSGANQAAEDLKLIALKSSSDDEKNDPTSLRNTKFFTRKLSLDNDEGASSAKKKLTPMKSSVEDSKAGPVSVLINHSFLFAVRHNKSSILICVGRMETIKER